MLKIPGFPAASGHVNTNKAERARTFDSSLTDDSSLNRMRDATMTDDSTFICQYLSLYRGCDGYRSRRVKVQEVVFSNCMHTSSNSMYFVTAAAVHTKCEKKKFPNWDAPTVFMPLIVVAQRQAAFIAFVEISQGY